MKLDAQQVAKIDPLLQEALSQAQGDEELRAIVVLDAPTTPVGQVLSPADFSTRQAYREALVAQRKAHMGSALEESLHQLRRLDLKPIGDSVSPVVMVEGSARQLLQALALSEVRLANLDQFIGLPQLAPAEQVDDLAKLYVDVLDRALDANTQHSITLACEQYWLNYYKNFGRVQVLGMPKPADLDSIYTAVTCLGNPRIGQIISEEELHQAFRSNIQHSFSIKAGEPIDGLRIAQQTQYLMVLGSPGAGKSTFLRKLGLETLKGKQGIFQGNYFPILLELKRFNKSNINLEQQLVYELEATQLPFANHFIHQALTTGKLLILLDGLDEVPTDNVDEAIAQMELLMQTFPRNRLIASCRIAAHSQNFILHQEILEKLTNVEITEFNDAQIQQFIQNWFSLEEDTKANTAEDFWNLISQPNYSGIKELARTPLLLIFLCLVYDQSQDFPSNRSTLYGEALDILLKKWWAQKRVRLNPIYRQLGIEFEMAMLAEIAHNSFIQNQLFFSQDQLVQSIDEFLTKNGDHTTELTPKFVLHTIAIQQGIWVERARNIYSFSHLTLQEYLTAQYLYDHGQINQLVQNHLKDKRWREVFLLVAGLMRGGADALVVGIERQARQYLTSPHGPQFGVSKLEGLLRWADQSTSSSASNCKPAAKRLVALALTLDLARALNRAKARTLIRARDYALALDHALALDITLDHDLTLNLTDHDFTLALDHALALDITLDHDLTLNLTDHDFTLDRNITLSRDLTLDRDLALNCDRAHIYEELKIFSAVNFVDLAPKLEDLEPTRGQKVFLDSTIEAWSSALHLDPQLLELSNSDVNELANYLAATQLMVDCKNAAVTVSHSTWTAIEERILKFD
jgi:hypothetical protein